MTATNHAMTGAIIGLSVANPVVAVVAAFASHFVLDAIPHFGMGPAFVKTRAFKIYLVFDALLCVALVGLLFALHSDYWFVPALAAFAAASPDLWSIKRFRVSNTTDDYTPGVLARFASRIQWFEKPIGALVEIAWAVCAILILNAIL